MRHRAFVAALAVATAACARDGNGAGPVLDLCEVVRPTTALPDGLDETSGVARSRADPSVVWTHNDSGGEPRVFAVRLDGTLVSTAELEGARNRDWEDLSVGPCGEGHCLYVGDIGDNSAKRDEVTIYRISEPSAGAEGSAPAEGFAFTYPGGPRDAESLFVLPDGGVYVVSKGRTSNIAVYRYPGPLRADEVVELEHVADLSAGRAELQAQVTGADASPDGKWVAIRSYGSLSLYRTGDLLAGRAPKYVVDLAPLGEAQGEAVAVSDDLEVVLTSEASGIARSGSMVVLRCTAPDAAAAGPAAADEGGEGARGRDGSESGGGDGSESS